ncbi:LemA family protein [Pasteurella skyensis]|uniref:LemA family protein n=1 Tax=Phocoenobacter skyensis TaxID=97481 RepID=A0AAJ6NA29_9PAST|nr:LemA family protein [Pasteurella skyensis]MDP8162134.1 LemA family protein [Pasteurella skyensis]MDP8172993.1 LemA family protein [Pasteurella skyensis]MDP8176760.1 LemA family protein [Pasteurella skyensis]MDP8179482.1 LemA family protein [Pasteurella skyensis]MDP8183664.1 LemA family protein [Pasteurella skyensis]
MKKWILIGLVVITVLGGFTLKNSYNGLVTAEEDINSVWGNVESAYQRRADLIPNLVNTVKGQANFEKETLSAVIEARAKATQTTIDPTKATPEQMEKFQQAQQGVNSALARLLVSVERYPELKAHEGFLNLQAQLEGTENRINVERNNFNNAVKEYNKKVRQFPTKLFAALFGFQSKPQFKASAGAENAPTVNFN